MGKMSKNQYSSLVQSAFDLYDSGAPILAAEALEESLSYSSLGTAETVIDWLNQFRMIATFEGKEFNPLSFVEDSSVQQLAIRVLTGSDRQPHYLSDVYSIPKVSIITSVFKGDFYIEHFLENIVQQTAFSECELILINANSPGNEEPTIQNYLNRYSNIRYLRLENDPGLYEVWNMGIKLSRGEYITNANLDDRRAPRHIEEHVKALESSPDIDVVCAPLKATRGPNETWEENNAYATWYMGYPKKFGLKDFFQSEENDEDKGSVCSQNIPHCMPVWRKKLHQKFGYFDETNYGASADWEFWLRCASNNTRFMLLDEPLGLYLEDPNSYNRRFEETNQFEQRIIKKYYEISLQEHKKTVPRLRELTDSQDKYCRSYPQKFNLNRALENNYGQHRSGWSYAMQCLKPLHSDNGVIFESFVEKKFVYGTDCGDAKNKPSPYIEPWVGVVHCPPNSPGWFQSELSPRNFFQTPLWKESIEYCKGLFCLTENMRHWLQKEVDCRVESLIHPTETPELKFSMDAFLANPDPKVVQVGHWLRKLHSIHYLRTEKYRKVVLCKEYAAEMFELEKKALQLEPDYSSVELVSYVSNNAYDQLLSENIVYIELYDTCANNAVIECIVRNTPILVNPLPGVVEYLGKDYPLYFISRAEAASKLNDRNLIQAAHGYLSELEIKQKLLQSSFVDAVSSSKIYIEL